MSNQCMALVKDDCLIPTKDVPELGYIKESSNEQYVPDVFYKVCHIQNVYISSIPVKYLLIMNLMNASVMYNLNAMILMMIFCQLVM